MNIRTFTSHCLRSQRQKLSLSISQMPRSPRSCHSRQSSFSFHTSFSLKPALSRSSQISVRGANRGRRWRFQCSNVKTLEMAETITAPAPGCCPDFQQTWRQHLPKPTRLERQRDQISPNIGMPGKRENKISTHIEKNHLPSTVSVQSPPQSLFLSPLVYLRHFSLGTPWCLGKWLGLQKLLFVNKLTMLA